MNAISYKDIPRTKNLTAYRGYRLFTKRDAIADNTTIEKIKKILSYYRDAVSAAVDSIGELEQTSRELGYIQVCELMEKVEMNIENEMTKRKVEKEVLCISQVAMLVEIVDMAITRIRTYPDHGPLYYTIITQQYTQKDVQPSKYVMKKVGLEHAQYYRRKKMALSLLASVLFEEILPALKNGWKIVSG